MYHHWKHLKSGYKHSAQCKLVQVFSHNAVIKYPAEWNFQGFCFKQNSVCVLQNVVLFVALFWRYTDSLSWRHTSQQNTESTYTKKTFALLSFQMIMYSINTGLSFVQDVTYMKNVSYVSRKIVEKNCFANRIYQSRTLLKTKRRFNQR